MEKHIGKTVFASGEAGPMTITDYRGKNKHGTPMFAVRLASKVTRVYGGHSLFTMTAKRQTPIWTIDGAQSAEAA